MMYPVKRLNSETMSRRDPMLDRLTFQRPSNCCENFHRLGVAS